MARTDTFNNWATDVADSIRNKTGKTDKIPANQFDVEIDSITTKEDLDEELTTYNNELAEQKISINDIKSALVGKAVGKAPEKGFIIDEIDANGYVTKITVVGFTDLPMYSFYGNTSYPSLMVWYLKEVVLPEGLTTIGEYSFINNIALSIKRFPDSLTWIKERAFQNDRCMTQFSAKGLKRVDGSAIGNPVFLNCTALKAVWVGSSFAAAQSFQTTYAFYKTGLTYLFIDSPRAEVEAANGYNVKWCGTTDYARAVTVICNDDPNWLTQDEFDAIDWSTYKM